MCQSEVNELHAPIIIDPLEVEIDDKDDEKPENDDAMRWTYFIVSHIDHEFASKLEARRWLQEFGVNDNKIIRGRILQVNEKVKRIITIG
jgi:hypothetical protein